MKTHEIIAHYIVDGKKVEAGRVTKQYPTTFDEAIEMELKESDVLDGYEASDVITEQRKLVALATKGQKSKAQIATENEMKLKARAREMKANGDSSLYDTLVQLEVIKD
jgi:hypothetical protein